MRYIYQYFFVSTLNSSERSPIGSLLLPVLVRSRNAMARDVCNTFAEHALFMTSLIQANGHKEAEITVVVSRLLDVDH